MVDTLNNTVLRSATVSIYQQGLTTVEKVGLTDGLGKFVYEDLSPHQSYRLEIRFQGYQTWNQTFSLELDQELDFGRVHLEWHNNVIEEIFVAPPVRMNGDTIEFNADAFLLDTNAVIEDLIHKLPGMIIWGDGAITYNGKEIPTVLINGKEFFGSDKSIALQNIAKEAVEKLQIYDTRDRQNQRDRPLDPQYEMNVILKEGQEKMVFGNVTAGLGTENRFENYLSLNYSSRQTQSSLAFANNNTNKKLNSLDQLLINTTFKGVGIHADYQPDFNQPGIYQQHVLTARHQYDFLTTTKAGLRNMITGSIFSNWGRQNLTNKANTIVASHQNNHSNKRDYNSVGLSNAHFLDGSVIYELAKEINGRPTKVQLDLKLSTRAEDIQNSISTDYDYYNMQSQTAEEEQKTENTKSADLRVRINWEPKIQARLSELGKVPTIVDKLRYVLDWSASVHDQNSLREISVHSVNRLDPMDNESINRNYNSIDEIHNQHLTFAISTGQQNLRLISSIDYSYSETDRSVKDVNEHLEVVNPFLSHVSNFRQLTYTPKVEYDFRIFHRNYMVMSKNLTLKPELSIRFLNRSNISTLDYRNIDQNLLSYLPKLGIEYEYRKYGAYFFTSALSYQHSEDFPTIHQLHPIYDDRNPNYRYFGNPNLSHVNKKTLAGSMRFEEHKVQSLSINFHTTYNLINKGIRDSIVFSPSQQRVYSVNIARNLYDLNIGIRLSKPFLIRKTQTFTLEFAASSFWSKNELYIDSELQELKPTNQYLNLITYYTNSEKYQISLKGTYMRYENRNFTVPTNSFSSKEYNIGVSLAHSITRKLKIGTNLNGRIIKSNHLNNKLTIWNADIAHRFTKGNNLEAKLVVYDILDQNKGIYIQNGVAEMTTGYQNNLRQFFQFSLTYYPRKYGF